MIRLSGNQLRQFHEALLDAFPSEDKLRQMVRFELNETLGSIAGGEDLSDRVFALIEWANTRGKLEQLIWGAQNSNADNPKLRAFISQLPAPAPPTSVVAARADAFARWRDLFDDLDREQCTPIL